MNRIPAPQTSANVSARSILAGLCLSRSAGTGAASPSSAATAVNFGPKAIIFVEGNPADTLFEVEAGVVMLYKLLLDGRRQVTGFAYPGDLFGLSGQESYSYSAQAIGPVKLLAISRARFNSVRTTQPGVDRRLFAAIGEDLRRAQEHILLLGRKTAIEKVSSFILGIWQQTGAAAEPPTPLVHLPVSRGDMADYLGLTVETISRTIAELKARKAIRLRSTDNIEILDVDALEDMAAGEELELAA